MKNLKTAIIGGGKGCTALLNMIFSGKLTEANLEIICVVDPLEQAPGMALARSKGIRTLSRVEEALALSGLDMVIELVGNDHFLEELYRIIPQGVRVLDHAMAQVFWDMEAVHEELEDQLKAREALQEQLMQSNVGLQRIFDSLPDAVIVVDKEKQVEWFNARLQEFTKLTSHDLFPGGLLEDPFCPGHGRDDPEHICALDEVIQTGQVRQLIYMDSDEKRSHSYFRIIYTPLFNEDGELEHVVETARPIDEMVVQAREVQESEKRFRQFVENARDLLTMKDKDGCYLMINERAASLFDMSPMDFIGRSDLEIFDRKLGESITKKDRAALSSRTAVRIEEVLSIKGKTRYLDTVRFPVFNYRGDLVGICGISREVTKQKRLEMAFIQSEKMAAIGKLAASVAHEINNPLTGILTFAQEMKRDLDPEPQNPHHEDLDIVIREAMRCRDIVANLLDYSRFSMTRREQGDLNQVIMRSLELVRKQNNFKRIEFDLLLDSGLPPACMDANQIQQVILNLVINAAEAMEFKGTIRIVSSEIAGQDMLAARVMDQGPGVPQSLMKKLFEPFISTKEEKGNGLGLSVVKTIMDQHGGRIEVSNRESGGAVFSILIPTYDPFS
jgi:two-component system NtrC family sensor kinase